MAQEEPSSSSDAPKRPPLPAIPTFWTNKNNSGQDDHQSCFSSGHQPLVSSANQRYIMLLARVEKNTSIRSNNDLRACKVNE